MNFKRIKTPRSFMKESVWEKEFLFQSFLKAGTICSSQDSAPQMSMTKIVGEIFNLKTEHIIF